MSDDLHLDGEFTLNIPHFEGVFSENDPPDIQADFNIKVTPDKVSQLENDLNYQTAEQVQAAIEQAELDIEGSALIGINHTVNTVTIVSQSYIHEQAIASEVWVIEHNLNKRPTVDAVDTAGNVQVPDDIHYDSDNQITVYFVAPFAGQAYLN